MALCIQCGRNVARLSRGHTCVRCNAERRDREREETALQQQLKEAILVRKLKKWRGDARLYKLTPALAENVTQFWFEEEHETDTVEYIVISQAESDHRGSETRIYFSDKNGNVEERNPIKNMRGSREQALQSLGYKLVVAPKVQKKVTEVKRVIRLED